MTDNHIRRQALSLDHTIAETRLRGPVRLSEFDQRESRVHPHRRKPMIVNISPGRITPKGGYVMDAMKEIGGEE